MEPLLSLSFSNISSRDSLKIRKGLRQIEGLLAQICLSTKLSQKGHNRRASVVEGAPRPCKKLEDLGADPAFLEFYRLQDGFEWNVSTHLIACLERLLSMPPNTSNDNLLLSALNLLQGMLLLHPPSKALFCREIYMILLLDLLSPSLPPTIQANTLSTLMITLLDHPRNARVFEKVNGLSTVSALLKEPQTTQTVHDSVLEFLYCYLLPEDIIESNGTYSTKTMRRVPENQSSSGETITISDTSILSDEAIPTLRNSREKQKMLGKHLGDLQQLFHAFETKSIFEDTYI